MIDQGIMQRHGHQVPEVLRSAALLNVPFHCNLSSADVGKARL